MTEENTANPHPHRRIVVLGVGNLDRGDDAIGRVVARRLRAFVPPVVEVREGDGVAADLIAAWSGADAVIVVDAARSGARPGTIHCFDAHAATLPPRAVGRTSHGFGVAEAIELARALGELPPSVTVYGIEAGGASAWSHGAELSPEVAAVVEEVVGRVQAEVRSLLGSSDDR